MARNTAFICLLALLSLMAFLQPLHAEGVVCLSCHSAPGFRKVEVNGPGKSLHIDKETLAASAHGKLKCLDCHVDFNNQKLPHKETAEPVQCVRCHHNGNTLGAPVKLHLDRYSDSVHGNALKIGDPDAPQCKTCHGTHDIMPASSHLSNVYRGNIPKTCGKCHFNLGFAKRHNLNSVKGYTDSVHAKIAMRKNGFDAAAVCTDCHGVHDILAPGNSNSMVNKASVPSTCGACHKNVLEQYNQSIHGKAAARGVKSAPVCTDCHGEHHIVGAESPGSPVSPTHVVATCSKCHENRQIQSKYGLPADRLSSYIGSYHGVANKYGDVKVANCATCHGAHSILPSSDPRSDINKHNIPKTCGKCHPGADKNFALGSIHVIPTPKQSPIVYWVRTFYVLFVAGLISSFCGYILLDLRARWIGRLPWKKGGHNR